MNGDGANRGEKCGAVQCPLLLYDYMSVNWYSSSAVRNNKVRDESLQGDR